MSRCLKLGVSTKCWHKYDLFVSQNFWSHFVIKILTAAHETLNFVTVVFIVPTYRFDEGHRKQLPGFSESVRPAERSEKKKNFEIVFMTDIQSCPKARQNCFAPNKDKERQMNREAQRRKRERNRHKDNKKEMCCEEGSRMRQAPWNYLKGRLYLPCLHHEGLDFKVQT